MNTATASLTPKKEEIKAPTLCFGEKLIGTTRVVHKGEKKVIEFDGRGFRRW